MLSRSLPLAEQVKNTLRERIRRGIDGPHGRLPSESQLAAELGVSRGTVRTALAALASQGLVTRKQGDGTYVNERALAIETRLEGVWEFTKVIRDSGREPTIRLLGQSRRPGSDKEVTALQIEPGTEVLVLQRLFLADGKPEMLSTNVIPIQFFRSQYSSEALCLPITSLIERYCGRHFGYAVADLSAVCATEELADPLKIPAHSPLLKVEEIFYDTAHCPLFCSINYHVHYPRLYVVHPGR